MSILDFTTGLFREPANLRSFVDDPDQALEDAGLPDATPKQVHDLLPVVAESMPPDHPLQAVVHSADPMRALAELDITSSSLSKRASRRRPTTTPTRARTSNRATNTPTITVSLTSISARSLGARPSNELKVPKLNPRPIAGWEDSRGSAR